MPGNVAKVVGSLPEILWKWSEVHQTCFKNSGCDWKLIGSISEVDLKWKWSEVELECSESDREFNGYVSEVFGK